MTSPRLHISHHSPGIMGWWISNPFLWSTYCIPSMVEGITQMSSPWAPTISPRLRAMSPFYRRGKSDSGAVRRPTEARLACWWWSPDSNLGLLTPTSDSFHTHPGPAVYCQAPSLPKRRPLRCFVSLKANQKNSLQFTAGISSIALWVFWWECIQGPITLSEIDTFPIKESNQNLAS